MIDIVIAIATFWHLVAINKRHGCNSLTHLLFTFWFHLFGFHSGSCGLMARESTCNPEGLRFESQYWQEM